MYLFVNFKTKNKYWDNNISIRLSSTTEDANQRHVSVTKSNSPTSPTTSHSPTSPTTSRIRNPYSHLLTIPGDQLGDSSNCTNDAKYRSLPRNFTSSSTVANEWTLLDTEIAKEKGKRYEYTIIKNTYLFNYFNRISNATTMINVK